MRFLFIVFSLMCSEIVDVSKLNIYNELLFTASQLTILRLGRFNQSARAFPIAGILFLIDAGA